MHKQYTRERNGRLGSYRRSRSYITSEVTRRLRTLFALTGVLLLIGLSLISSKCYADTPVPLDDPTYAWFKLGSNVGVLLDRYWNDNIDHASSEPYERVAELMTKLHVTESTVRSFQAWQTQTQNLTWTNNAEAAYTEARFKASGWFTGLKNQAASQAPSRFFFLLGYHSGKVFRRSGLDVSYRNPLTPEEVATFRDAASDFHALATDSLYQKIIAPLTNDVRNSITMIASYGSKLESDPASLTMDDIQIIANHCGDLKATGQHGETFYPAPEGGTWLIHGEAPLFL
jgi:hypothetical protein